MLLFYISMHLARNDTLKEAFEGLSVISKECFADSSSKEEPRRVSLPAVKKCRNADHGFTRHTHTLLRAMNDEYAHKYISNLNVRFLHCNA